MRIKTRRTAAVVIFTVLIALLSVLLLLPNGTATASAATTPLYSVQFSYTAYRGVYADSASIVQAEGTNVYETESFECGKASVETVVSFQIYGSTNSGTGKLPYTITTVHPCAEGHTYVHSDNGRFVLYGRGVHDL